MADRCYCPLPPVGGVAVLEGDEARHLVRVRRASEGNPVEVFDGRGSGYAAVIRRIGKDRVELEVVGPPLPDRQAPVLLILGSAVPKGERFDWLVEKATELGVDRLVPIVTARSSVDPRAAKLDRLRRVIVEASKQCGRNRLMTLDAPTSFASFLGMGEGPARLLAHPGAEAASWPALAVQGQAVVAVGPEGGFTEAEVQEARQAGWSLLGLGSTLLRVETAGLAAVSLILGRARTLEETGRR